MVMTLWILNMMAFVRLETNYEDYILYLAQR